MIHCFSRNGSFDLLATSERKQARVLISTMTKSQLNAIL